VGALTRVSRCPDRNPRAGAGGRRRPSGETYPATDAMMKGTVSLPHGYGHGRPGIRMRVASEYGGASVNDVIDAARIDPVCGASSATGVPVEVTRAG
jgi:hypothetical protein